MTRHIARARSHTRSAFQRLSGAWAVGLGLGLAMTALLSANPFSVAIGALFGVVTGYALPWRTAARIVGAIAAAVVVVATVAGGPLGPSELAAVAAGWCAVATAGVRRAAGPYPSALPVWVVSAGAAGLVAMSATVVRLVSSDTYIHAVPVVVAAMLLFAILVRPEAGKPAPATGGGAGAPDGAAPGVGRFAASAGPAAGPGPGAHRGPNSGAERGGSEWPLWTRYWATVLACAGAMLAGLVATLSPSDRTSLPAVGVVLASALIVALIGLVRPLAEDRRVAESIVGWLVAALATLSLVPVPLDELAPVTSPVVLTGAGYLTALAVERSVVHARRGVPAAIGLPLAVYAVPLFVA